MLVGQALWTRKSCLLDGPQPVIRHQMAKEKGCNLVGLQPISGFLVPKAGLEPARVFPTTPSRWRVYQIPPLRHDRPPLPFLLQGVVNFHFSAYHPCDVLSSLPGLLGRQFSSRLLFLRSGDCSRLLERHGFRYLFSGFLQNR
jgi:hypothetical protein